MALVLGRARAGALSIFAAQKLIGERSSPARTRAKRPALYELGILNFELRTRKRE